MTLKSDLQAVLNPLASGGAWDKVAAQGTAPPYITWQMIVSPANVSFGGASNLQNTRVQIDVYARTGADTEALAKAIATAMAAASFKNVPLSVQEFYEPEVKLHRISLDYSLWST